MTSASSTFKQYRPALTFIGKFVGLYLVLNFIYGLFVEAYRPSVDPITLLVARHSEFVISLFNPLVSTQSYPHSPFVPFTLSGRTIINVFEGCNSVNVIIVYVAFIVAFSTRWFQRWRNVLLDLAVVYGMNLIRIVLLFYIALYFPEGLYFFHKFLFTGIIYAVVFVLWYLWVKRSRSDEKGI
ncbi:MAG TPA: exosortase family protein XrtF [Chryseosolibacter sp.]